MPEKIHVQSSNVEAVAYEAESMTLHVWFNSDSHYCYSGVPEDLYQGLLYADSVGSFLNREIKGTYNYQQIS